MSRGRDTSDDPYLQDDQRRVYVTPAYFEVVHGRSLRTVRHWARTDRVRTMWHNGTLYVHLQDCLTVDRDTPKQRRAARTG